MHVTVKSVYAVTMILLTQQILDGLLFESSIHYSGAK
mgnify:CR=1 FL=1